MRRSERIVKSKRCGVVCLPLADISRLRISASQMQSPGTRAQQILRGYLYGDRAGSVFVVYAGDIFMRRGLLLR